MAEATTASDQITRLLFLHAQTSLHPGSGTGLGTVDLPVQRERHTQWPTISGSALKGILRDVCRERAKEHYSDEYEENDGERRLKQTRRRRANEQDPLLVAAFGPGKVVDESSAHAGAVSLTDARILAFPVRSLRGVFAWVTCRTVLGRLERDLRLAQRNGLEFPEKWPDANEAFCPTGSPLVLGKDHVILEEFEFTPTGDSSEIAAWVADRAIVPADTFTPDRLRTHLVILHDDDFTHFVRHATEVVARIGLDYEKKTVTPGALFYQEFLPAETIFYSLVFVNDSRTDREKCKLDDVLLQRHSWIVQMGRRSGETISRDVIARYLQEEVAQVLQVGGDETTGKGLCAVRLDNGKAGGQ